jgi:hypothetical protein
VSDAGVTVVRDRQALASLVQLLLSPERAVAVVAVTGSRRNAAPALDLAQVREIVGPAVPVHFIAERPLLCRFQRAVGRRMALPPWGARIWWPGLSKTSNPRDHPSLWTLETESSDDALTAFACSFDLSRPHVRREINLIEEAHALTDHRLEQTGERLLDSEENLRRAKLALRDALAAATAAEAQLNALLHRQGSM